MSKEIKNLINTINKKFGDNSVNLGFKKEKEVIERIPTGSISLDISLGGGIPIGRYTQIEGAYSSTKSTQCIHIVREAQKMNLTCAYFDVEGTLDKLYFETHGIDINKLIYIRPSGLEEITQMLIDFQKSGLVHLAIWDSIEASSPLKELDSNMEDTVQLGIKPKLLSEYFRKYQAYNNKLSRENKRPFTLIATNQLRDKIGVMFGETEFASGGRAKDFTSSVNIRLRKGDWIVQGKNENKEIIGQVVKYKIEKNKTYKRMQTGEFDFYFAENDLQIPIGCNDNIKSIIQESVAWGLIERGGAWFFLDKEKNIKFQGLDKLIAYLRENEEVVKELKDKILNISSFKND